VAGAVYLGIDQSYSGLALVAYDAETGGIRDQSLTSWDAKRHGSGVDRLVAIYHHVFEWVHAHEDITHVCMEGYANGAKFGREIAGELAGFVKLALYEALPVPICYPTIVAPTALKKYVTGSGAAKKNEILLAVYRKWGEEFTNDNLADAYALSRIAFALTSESELLAYEREVISKLTRHTEWAQAPNHRSK
jgi:Holliday junction resolvasome RuvABC endonuclease subunit